ncbi:hypothetical protein ABZX12_41210 [Kribbella sp. NPDC003505]|uniref:hypothetical protein n=1 Tax=Kribbella sp. NPDC003505 TaxID=3154448 RepID=UPI0033BA515E
MAERDEVNATMLVSDNARLLKPILLGPDCLDLNAPLRPVGATGDPRPVSAGAVYQLDPSEAGFAEFFTARVLPVPTGSGAAPRRASGHSLLRATFLLAPLRVETVLTWLAPFPDDAAYDEHLSVACGIARVAGRRTC